MYVGMWWKRANCCNSVVKLRTRVMSSSRGHTKTETIRKTEKKNCMSLEKIIKLAAKIIDLISISLKIFTNSGDSSLSLSLSRFIRPIAVVHPHHNVVCTNELNIFFLWHLLTNYFGYLYILSFSHPRQRV